MNCSTPGFSVKSPTPRNLLKLMSISLVMPSSHLILCHPLLLLTSIFSIIRVFSDESVLCIRWPKYWSFSFSIGPSSEYSGLISFRMNCLDHLAVQGTLQNLLQHHSSKASILQHSALLLLLLLLFIVVDFVKHWNETAMGLHVFPIPIPPPTSLSPWSF